MKVIKFRLVKFEKSILFQLIGHSFDLEWLDSIHIDFKLLAIPDKRLSIYFKKAGISDSYISLECEKFSGRKVEVQSFRNNEIRDEFYNMYLKALENFALQKDKFKLIQQ